MKLFEPVFQPVSVSRTEEEEINTTVEEPFASLRIYNEGNKK